MTVSVKRYYHEVLSRYRSLPWTSQVLCFAVPLFAAEFFVKPEGLTLRALEKLVVFVLVPLAFVRFHGRDFGLRLDRRVAAYTVLLCLFVLPFYVFAGSIPVMRSFYPVGGVHSTALGFAGHQFQQFFLALGTEVFYRGVLCVWISDIGRRSVLVSPVVYAARHVSKPGPEFLGSAPADVVFGAFDYRVNSIVPSVVAHWLGMALTDYFCSVEPVFPVLGSRAQELVFGVLAVF